MSHVWKIVEPILRGYNDAAVAVDEDGMVLFYNAPFEAMTGLGRRALAKMIADGIPVFDLLGAETRADREIVSKCFTTNRVYRLAEIPVLNAQGHRVLVWFSAIPVTDQGGRVVAVIEQFRDVSAEARMQVRFKELLALSRARADDLERIVESRTRELAATFEEVRRLSRTDPLTGLLNRRAFGELAEASLSAAKRHERRAALVMCDLDHFKKVNDQYGHAVGDVVLTTCAQVLERTFRDIDTVARFGGEEFVVFLGETTADGAMRAAVRCKEKLESSLIKHKTLTGPLQQTGSFGVSVYPDHGTSLDELLQSADHALYAAKKMGRNRVVLSGISGWEPQIPPGVRPPGKTLRPEPPDTNHEPQAAEALTDRVLVIDPAEERGATYHDLLASHFEVTCTQTPLEALDLCQDTQFTVFVVEMDQAEHSGLFVLAEIFRQQPGAMRMLMVEDAAPYEKLLESNLASVDHVLLHRDAPHLPDAIESCRARRDSRRAFPLANSPQPLRWLLHADEMARIMKEGRISVAFQPIVAGGSAELFAHEVLCRVRPESIPIIDLFDWALREGEVWNLGRRIREKAIFRLERDPEAILFFNLHPAELFDPELAGGMAALDRYAERVVFEITERAAIGDFARMRSAMRRLGERGYRFAIDDLGAGYAGLSSVAMLSPHFIKVDMAIIRDIDKLPTKARLLKSIIEFAEAEGVQIVAEGIETEAEAAVVRDLGCHLLQGYYFGRPVIEEEPADRKSEADQN